MGDLREFWIPDYILNSDSEHEDCLDEPQCPVIVFVNSKSGGQLGGGLLDTYRSLLNKNQVCWMDCCTNYECRVEPVALDHLPD